MPPRSLVGLLLCLVLGLAQAAASLESRQSEAQTERNALRAQIRDLQGRIESTESLRQDASLKLKASEEAISDIGRRLDELARRHTSLRESLKALDAAIAAQSAEMKRQQDALAAQLRAQYASGLSPWTALLSGDDPQEIGRELAYLAYLSRARIQALGDLRNSIDKLSALQAEADTGRKDLQVLLADTEAQKKNLQVKQAERQKVLADIQSQLQAQRGQARELETREQRLGTLIKGLGVEIEHAEARRKAEAQEAARRAEAARQARAEAAKHAKQEREQAELAERETEPPPREDTPRAMPSGGFPGLKKGLPTPVKGEVLGRFGTQRPDGGVWRGIVLRAATGTLVHAIAAGQVVYASWLSGFGNILIIDHGQQYLSVYAYNQSLLRQVGDIVAAGDTIARVGATGGQVEPGLYFEIRHDGAPINPQLWLRP